MIRDDIVLYANGGDLTVGRQTAVYTYGNFRVVLPEGREQDPGDDRLAEGYISRPPTDRPRGRFDIGFVRADATIDLDAGISDLESVIDTAQKRTAGDVFFERDITAAGLGRYQPGVDFDEGDLVQVDIGGKRMRLPVTAVEMVVSETDGTTGWRVHVGGQLISDAAALKKQNSDLEAQLAAEKRQRLREAGQIRGTADAALRLADPPRNLVPDDEDGRPFWTLGATRDDSDLPQSGDPTWASTTWTGYSAATAGDGPEAFVELSDQIDWKLGVWAKLPGVAHVRLLDEHGEDVVEEWRQHRPLGNLWFPQGRVIIEPLSEEWERYEFVFRLKPGTKAARVVVESPGLTAPLNELGLTVHSRTKEDLDAFQSAQIAENRALHDALELQVQKIDRLQRYLIGSTHENIEQTIPNQAVSSVDYTQIYIFTTATAITWDLYFRIGWDQADRGSSYELMVAVNGVIRYSFISTSLGPLTLFGESYARQSMTRQNVSLQEGDTISFWAWSNASSGPRRRIRDGVINLTQVI